MQQFSFIYLLICLNLVYIFRATNSLIFSSTFDCIQLWYNAPILLPTGDKTEMEMISSISPLSPVGTNIGAFYQSAPENGRIFRPKHVEQIQIDQ